MSLPRSLILFGTRPEVIKVAPLVRELRARGTFEVILASTGQQRELVQVALQDFGLTADHDLDLMVPDQSLHQLSADVLTAVHDLIDAVRPDMVVVQGDTTSACMGSLAAFYRGVPVAHVEAGLRTGDVKNPFPEEVNRRLIGVLADVHFAPTEASAANLLREGVPAERVHVTGNTVVDALRWRAHESPRHEQLRAALDQDPSARHILVTCHRRENHGAPLDWLCDVLLALLQEEPGVEILFPVHPGPRVQQRVRQRLGSVDRVHLLPPLPYSDFLAAMSRSTLILSDSGGVQEEAPVLGKPVVVFRRVTERPEGLGTRNLKVLGVEGPALVEECRRLLNDPLYLAERSQPASPFGDGRAAPRIADIMTGFLPASRSATHGR